MIPLQFAVDVEQFVPPVISAVTTVVLFVVVFVLLYLLGKYFVARAVERTLVHRGFDETLVGLAVSTTVVAIGVVAVALAAERPVGGAILEAPFSSIVELAQSIYWYTPAKWLVRDRFDSIGRIGHVEAPLLMLHGGQDRTIPPRFGRRLYAAAPQPKRLWFHEDADHLDLWDRGGDRAIRAFLADVAG